MPEQRHQRLQAHTGIGELGGPGMPQLVRGDNQGPAASAAQPRPFNGGEQPVAQPGLAEAAAVRDEQKIGQSSSARMRQWSADAALGGPLVQHRDGGGRERHHALGREFAQRHLQPGPGRAVVDDAVELEIEQFPDPQPRPAERRQPDAGERILQSGNSVHYHAVDVGCQCAGQGLVELGDVGSEDQPARWCLLPAPFGEIVE